MSAGRTHVRRAEEASPGHDPRLDIRSRFFSPYLLLPLTVLFVAVAFSAAVVVPRAVTGDLFFRVEQKTPSTGIVTALRPGRDDRVSATVRTLLPDGRPTTVTVGNAEGLRVGASVPLLCTRTQCRSTAFLDRYGDTFDAAVRLSFIALYVGYVRGSLRHMRHVDRVERLRRFRERDRQLRHSSPYGE